MTRGKRRNGIVADGLERNRREEIDRIRIEVRSRYEDELARAGILRRLWLRYLIYREVRRKLNEVTPNGALYAQHKLRSSRRARR